MENSSPSISSLTLRNWLSDRYGVKPYLNEAPAWSTWRVQRCRTGSFWDSSGTGTPRYLGMPGKCDGRRQTVTRPRLCPGWLSRTREPRASSKQRDACLSGNSWSGIRHKKVKLTLTTHVAGGLTENDFILAAQCNKAFAKCLEP
jgi:hypothetical protein